MIEISIKRQLEYRVLDYCEVAIVLALCWIAAVATFSFLVTAFSIVLDGGYNASRIFGVTVFLFVWHTLFCLPCIALDALLLRPVSLLCLQPSSAICACLEAVMLVANRETGLYFGLVKEGLSYLMLSAMLNVFLGSTILFFIYRLFSALALRRLSLNR